MDGRTGGSGVASPAVEPSVQSGWKGWDVWVALDSAWRFAARWLRQLAEGPLLNRSLFAGAGVGSNGVLPVALVTTILLAGALFRSPQGGPTRLGRANQTFEPSNLPGRPSEPGFQPTLKNPQPNRPNSGTKPPAQAGKLRKSISETGALFCPNTPDDQGHRLEATRRNNPKTRCQEIPRQVGRGWYAQALSEFTMNQADTLRHLPSLAVRNLCLGAVHHSSLEFQPSSAPLSPQTPSLPVPRPANDAAREKQIPLRSDNLQAFRQSTHRARSPLRNQPPTAEDLERMKAFSH